MQEINIKLWRHSEEQDWSAEVYGKLHEHVSTKTVDELVEYVLIATQQTLLEPESPPARRVLPVRKGAPSSATQAGIHIVALVS